MELDARFHTPGWAERRLRELREGREEKNHKSFSMQVSRRILPPNTLTNADGTPYQAGYDSAIDQQAVRAHHHASAFAKKLTYDLFYGPNMGLRNPEDIQTFEHFLKERAEKLVLAVLQEGNT